jgi:hypothetical protein
MNLAIIHSPFDTWDDSRRMCYSAFMHNGKVFYVFNN